MQVGRTVNDICVLKAHRILPYQFFREWLEASCLKSGIARHWDFPLVWGLRVVIGKLGFCFPMFVGRKKMLVLSGGRPEYFAWPWCYFYEIVPVVWDCWPKWFPYLVKFVRRNAVKTIFCTASQTAQRLKEAIPSVNAVWLPEGVDASLYPMGAKLVERPIDVLELGRQMKHVHEALIALSELIPDFRHQYQKGPGLLFKNFDALTQGMRESKIAICYPRCDTHPEEAGDIETMTQRYWECMLSGTLMVGRAPKELVNFCGYNPVIELGKDAQMQISCILEHIVDYQSLVDRNRSFAEKHASWDSRMPMILESIK